MKIDYKIIPDRENRSLTERDIYSAINKGLKKLLVVLEDNFNLYQDRTPDKKNLETVFKEFFNLYEGGTFEDVSSH